MKTAWPLFCSAEDQQNINTEDWFFLMEGFDLDSEEYWNEFWKKERDKKTSKTTYGEITANKITAGTIITNNPTINKFTVSP